MHRELRAHLSKATGESDLVVVIFLDVRGFSSFAGMAESSEAALFLRSFYTQVLDTYFPEAAFFKPTGDGLMIIRHFDDESLNEVVFDSIQRSVALTRDFAELTSEDPMVNFDVPTDLGIGIARGAATRLTSGDYTLDYSGRPLNLAARLMDIARPQGVVVDDRVLKGLEVPDEIQQNFERDEVYVKGIADLQSIPILRTTDVEVRALNRRPLLGEPHRDSLESITLKQCEDRGRYIHRPQQEPLDPDAVRLAFQHPKVAGGNRKHPEMWTSGSLDSLDARRTPSGWDIIFDYSKAVDMMKERGVKSTWEVRVALEYSVQGSSGPTVGPDA